MYHIALERPDLSLPTSAVVRSSRNGKGDRISGSLKLKIIFFCRILQNTAVGLRRIISQRRAPITPCCFDVLLSRFVAISCNENNSTDRYSNRRFVSAMLLLEKAPARKVRHSEKRQGSGKTRYCATA
jgi:hypothetical protein